MCDDLARFVTTNQSCQELPSQMQDTDNVKLDKLWSDQTEEFSKEEEEIQEEDDEEHMEDDEQSVENDALVDVDEEEDRVTLAEAIKASRRELKVLTNL